MAKFWRTYLTPTIYFAVISSQRIQKPPFYVNSNAHHNTSSNNSNTATQN